jgi:ribosomal protein S18 acetylase RimI-like enzyme
MRRAISFRPALDADRPFIEAVYCSTQRWLIEELFGWRGDDVERAKFAEFYDEQSTSVIVVDGRDAGWLTILRGAGHVELEHLYLQPSAQGRGVGTAIIRNLIAEAEARSEAVRLSTARINPARRLYERLGFTVVDEDQYKVYMTKEPPALRRGP